MTNDLANLAQMLRMNTPNTTGSLSNGAMPGQMTLMPTYITDNLNGYAATQNPSNINSFYNMYNNAQPSTVGMVGTMNPGLIGYANYLNSGNGDPTEINKMFKITE